MGEHSLTGIAVNQGWEPVTDKKIEIQFEESSFDFRKNNDGPEWVMVPEYVFGCLCRNVLELNAKGIAVIISEYSTK